MPLTQGAVDNIRLGAGGTYSTARDAVSHRLWDTRLIGTTISDYTFFSQPVGSPWRVAGTTKSLNETNMYDLGKLPNGQTFLVHRIGVACIVPQDSASVVTQSYCRCFNNLLGSSVFEIKVQGREWDNQIHGRLFMPMPISEYGVATANSFRVGDMIASGWISLGTTPLFLDQLVGFSVIQRLNNPDANVVTILNADSTVLNGVYGMLMVILEGFLTRAK
jgi:hypothetical protein